MRRIALTLIAALSVTAISACNEKRGNVSSPPAPVESGTPATPVEPYVCPPGMPSYKCQQLQDLHDPNRHSP